MQHFVDKFEQIPVVILATAVRKRPGPTETLGASVYPACQNLLLAARTLGYGGVMMMWHALVADELRALLGIPTTCSSRRRSRSECHRAVPGPCVVGRSRSSCSRTAGTCRRTGCPSRPVPRTPDGPQHGGDGSSGPDRLHTTRSLLERSAALATVQAICACVQSGELSRRTTHPSPRPARRRGPRPRPRCWPVGRPGAGCRAGRTRSRCCHPHAGPRRCAARPRRRHRPGPRVCAPGSTGPGRGSAPSPATRRCRTRSARDPSW